MYTYIKDLPFFTSNITFFFYNWIVNSNKLSKIYWKYESWNWHTLHLLNGNENALTQISDFWFLDFFLCVGAYGHALVACVSGHALVACVSGRVLV